MMGIHITHARSAHSTHTLSRALALAMVLTSSAWFCLGQKALAEPGGAAARGGAAKPVSAVIPAFLDTSVDSKKRSAGDEVVAKAAAPIELPDGTVIPRGAKLVGHITGAKARSKGDTESSLNIVFEKVTLADGKILNIKGYLQAVAPSPDAGQSGGGVDYGNSINRTLQHAGPGEDSHSAVPILTAQSVGVAGIKDLALDGDGVLTSPGKTVKLEHGTQMMLRAQVVAAQ